MERLKQRAAMVIELAMAAHVILAVGAGAFAVLLADAPGAAEVLHGGFVVYTKENKTTTLGVRPA